MIVEGCVEDLVLVFLHSVVFKRCDRQDSLSLAKLINNWLFMVDHSWSSLNARNQLLSRDYIDDGR